MLRHIEELREKPKAVRNQYAFAIALSVTFVIAAVWAISLPARLTLEEPVIAEQEEAAGPTFTEQLSEVNSFFGEGLEEIKTQAELIGVAQPLQETPEPVVDTISDTDTAHYDFFPPSAGADEGNSFGEAGEGNQ